MSLNTLITQCLGDRDALSLARQQAERWQPWLQPISADSPVGEDPGYDDDFQRMREEVNKLSGADAERVVQMAEKLLIHTCKDLRVRNLCAPSLPCYPPNRDRFHWRVLSHLGSNFLPMLDSAEVLRGTLALYDWTGSELNRRRLEAIVEVSHHLIQRFEKGFLLRGVDIEVTLDANGFSGEGDISLFGEMLNRFFGLYADIHLYNQLTLILQPSGKCLR